MKRTFRATPSRIHSNSYNVIEVGRKNRWGDPYVVACATTREAARKLADDLNAGQPCIDLSTGETLNENA